MRRTAWLLAATALAQDPGLELFEKKIRPVLAEKCYACHSSKAKSPMGGLALDTRDALRQGGRSGPAIAPSKPAESRIIRAIRYGDPQLRMPPTGKLGDTAIADFERWIEMGAPDPRTSAGAPAAKKGIDFEKGRRWWAFQPAREHEVPPSDWARTKIDRFVLAKLAENGLKPSPEAEKRTLIRRAYFDLVGLPPSYDEVEAFARDASPEAYPKLIEKLLASKQYGERWGRYWLDVARWAEDNPTSEATNRPYPNSWRYRDWVIEAVNADMPYDRFLRMQFAADLLPNAKPQDFRALGYLGTAPIYHKDVRLGADVIETLAADDWDERVDAVSRGLLGLTAACARCHDHKFDAISSKDYHALAGVFASLWQVQRPVVDVKPEAADRLMWDFERAYRLEGIVAPLSETKTIRPELIPVAADLKAELTALRAKLKEEKTPMAHGVIDCGVWIDGSDPTLTWIHLKPGTPRDLPVWAGGNVTRPGEIVPRRFLTVLSKGDPEPFRRGSGRLELVEKILGDAAPLAARVWVNRVWAWHFGRPLVGTPSDFGTQGEKPSHPELLDDLAARFIANGWSLGWLHREIMLSSAYRQRSAGIDTAYQADPANRWLWRMNPRRLDIEAWRDTVLAAAQRLDLKMGGPSQDLDAKDGARRTVYARISRGRPQALLRLFDFPDVNQHSPAREATTTPLQQLFVFNSEWMRYQASHLADKTAGAQREDRIRALYRSVFSREPKPREIELGTAFLTKAGSKLGRDAWVEYAQALLGSNELMYWP
ncbi:MAG: PSD1 and planctomycete cytochrome C domain-containing protein [Bryobacteraceae bacterium]